MSVMSEGLTSAASESTMRLISGSVTATRELSAIKGCNLSTSIYGMCYDFKAFLVKWYDLLQRQSCQKDRHSSAGHEWPVCHQCCRQLSHGAPSSL